MTEDTASHGRDGCRPLQAVVALLALVPVSAGLAGVLTGAGFLGVAAAPADLDSHLRFLSGLFLMVGLGFWSCVPNIGTKTGRFRLLAALVFSGGLARLWSLRLVGEPSVPHLAGLALELVAVPLLVLWQARVARRSLF